MIEYNPKDYLISLHIAKCGGSSFDKILRRWFSIGLRRHYYNHKKSAPASKASTDSLLYKFFPLCIHGHFDKKNDGVGVFDYYPEAKQFISCYRNPLEIQLSYYFYTKKLAEAGTLYWGGKRVTNVDYLGKDVDEHLEICQHDWLIFFPWDLTLDNYVNIIEKNFVHIGLTEDLQKSVDVLAEKLGKRKYKVPVVNTAERYEKPSESSIRAFKEKNKLPFAIYDYVQKLNS